MKAPLAELVKDISLILRDTSLQPGLRDDGVLEWMLCQLLKSVIDNRLHFLTLCETWDTLQLCWLAKKAIFRSTVSLKSAECWLSRILCPSTPAASNFRGC